MSKNIVLRFYVCNIESQPMAQMMMICNICGKAMQNLAFVLHFVFERPPIQRCENIAILFFHDALEMFLRYISALVPRSVCRLFYNMLRLVNCGRLQVAPVSHQCCKLLRLF
eukprot:TRINITY_DN10416_c0_g1_i2.p1 TRINITY_DN10416_c0_g1~~TRINITY_DN10416_c0_g1_i2.p1  ORF type:complete len:112 (-),score=8.62 TRINITY_DN10416_c0_g1_i2:26-361(-)